MVVHEECCNRKKRTETSFRPPALVTSTAFDNDEAFISVAKAMLLRYEQEGMSERDSINAILTSAEEKRAFLESLDLRYSTMYINEDENFEESLVNDVVQRTRYIFSFHLKALWRECSISDCGEADMTDEEFVLGIDGHEYRQPLKTPKNLHSPIISSRSESETPCLSSKSSGKQRRRFFPDSFEQPPSCRSRLRLDFKLAGAQQVDSLQLDPFVQPPIGTYAPPSPIESDIPRARLVSN